MRAIPSRLMCLALLAGGEVFAQVQEFQWRVVTIDASGGIQPSLALRPNGRPMISYYNNALRVAEATGSTPSGTWLLTTIDSSNEAGRDSTIVFGSRGNPAIVYKDDASGSAIRVAQFFPNACIPGWGPTTVARFEPTTDPLPQSTKPSVAFGPGFQPSVSFYWFNAERSRGELRFARPANLWTISMVDDALGSSSMAFVGDQPVIAYHGTTGIRFARLVGATWNTVPVDTTGDSPSLALDPATQPAIAYRANGSLRFARLSGSSWSITTVDSTGESPSLAFGQDGQPGIAYVANGLVRFARFNGAAWNTMIVDPAGGATPSLVFGADGLPLIAYARAGIRLAQASPAPQPPPPPPTISSSPQSQTTIAGGNTTLSVTASGVDLRYQWKLNGVDIPGATGSTHAIPSAQSFHSGTYTVVISNDAGSVTSQPVTVTVNASTRSDARLTNISNRAFCGTGAQTMICGFVISSDGPKTLLIRAVGPTLGATFGVPGVLADPLLRVYRHEASGAETLILTNDDWSNDPGADRATTAAVTARVGAFALPPGSKDAALVATLQPGVYTVHASGAGGLTGTALIEVYEAP